ncbi:MAG: type II toxin-antitoxin system RelB/DinJ family antitoxin [Aerococcus sp.]|nr:type II toxin-antitoxin system RelB/DinJ family antitoxin [Aerococcus sp.]
MAKVSTNIRIDQEVKQQAKALFEDLGLDLSTAVNLFLRKAIDYRGIPFEVTREVPNKETLETLKEVEYMKSHPEEYKYYDSVGEMTTDILSDDDE